MQLKRKIKSTLTPLDLDHGDIAEFEFTDGSKWTLTLTDTSASVIERKVPTYEDASHYQGDIAVYEMVAVVEINSQTHTLTRQVGSQTSFYEPWVIDGMKIWFDAARCAFAFPPGKTGIIHEKDARTGLICSPRRGARFAFQQADMPIAPEPIGPWFEGQKQVPVIEECYMGQDCWMGPYAGGSAHCGLDINMPQGTLLTAPITLDDQYMQRSFDSGAPCQLWYGRRRWEPGTSAASDWHIQCHHIEKVLASERCPVKRGTKVATAAGSAVGIVEHSHFYFRIEEQGGSYPLDPWIIFGATDLNM